VDGKFSESLVMKVEEATEYYEKLIAKERERYADN
jgi:hypothetical protein